jgi:predicted metalloprotease
VDTDVVDLTGELCVDTEGRRQSSNVEDRRGMRMGRTGAGLSIGGVLFLVVLSLLGINPLPFLGMATQQQAPEPQARPADQPYQEGPEEAKLREVALVVLADTEEAWSAILPKYGVQYVAPKLVLYNGGTQTACGDGQSAMGPFYCPKDRSVYLDLSFFKELESRFGAPGDFAQGYVVAHEVGHHVQNLLGTSDKVRAAQQRAGKVQANELSVRLELQADCYAGVWAKNADQSRQLLQAGDIKEGLNAANAIGDDRLQREATGGSVSPDSFTHGTSEQRMHWFTQGYQTGSPENCDTFGARTL